MLPVNPSSFLPGSKPPPFLLNTPVAAFRFRAAADSIPPQSWSNLPAVADAAAGKIVDGSTGNNVSSPASRSNSNKDVKINAKEKWSRHRESYLIDDTDALPLPMTHPDSTPVSADEIDKRLNCDPQIMDCKPVVYEWTGKCRSCQGTGLVSYYSKKGKETICKCIPCLGVGYVQKLTARRDIDVMEDLDNAKPS